MGAVYFYHLTRSDAEQALSMLIERSLAAGWRVAVRLQDRARAEWLDQKLWLGSDESFLPHGLAGGAHDGLQPVLLTTGAVPDGVQCLMALDRTEVSAAEVTALERVCVIFDGNDDGAVAAARVQWKALTGAGLAALYWSEESGRWQKKAESGGA